MKYKTFLQDIRLSDVVYFNDRRVINEDMFCIPSIGAKGNIVEIDYKTKSILVMYSETRHMFIKLKTRYNRLKTIEADTKVKFKNGYKHSAYPDRYPCVNAVGTVLKREDRLIEVLWKGGKTTWANIDDVEIVTKWR